MKNARAGCSCRTRRGKQLFAKIRRCFPGAREHLEMAESVFERESVGGLPILDRCVSRAASIARKSSRIRVSSQSEVLMSNIVQALETAAAILLSVVVLTSIIAAVAVKRGEVALSKDRH